MSESFCTTSGGGDVILDFLRFSSSLSTGRWQEGARGCELRFRDKGDERKAGKQRAKCVHERPFDIMRCSSFVARIRNINANGDRYVSTSIATRAYEPLVSYFIFPFETARRFTSSKGLKLVANRHVHVLIILSVQTRLNFVISRHDYIHRKKILMKYLKFSQIQV